MQESLCPSHFFHQRLNCWHWSPFAVGGSSGSMGAQLGSLNSPHSVRQGFLTGLSLGFPLLSVTCLDPYFNHCAITEEQLELVPLRKYPSEGIPGIFCPCSLSVWKSGVFLLSPQLLTPQVPVPLAKQRVIATSLSLASGSYHPELNSAAHTVAAHWAVCTKSILLSLPGFFFSFPLLELTIFWLETLLGSSRTWSAFLVSETVSSVFKFLKINLNHSCLH